MKESIIRSIIALNIIIIVIYEDIYLLVLNPEFTGYHVMSISIRNIQQFRRETYL